MAFTKFANFEDAQVLDLKGSQTRLRSASLDKVGEYADYRTNDGYLYARIRAISSRVNKNHDGWPSVELAGGQDVFDRHHSAEGGFTVEADASQKYGYSTFLGKPIFVDHHNSNPERARGVIVDAKLHVEDHKTAALDPYYASEDCDSSHKPATWVELLLEVDAKSFPKLAKAIIDGSKNSKKGIDGFSMGCDVERSECNICKNSASSPDEYCDHIRMKGAHFDHYDDKGHKTSKKSYENCYGVKFFEISAVFDPADETALVKEVRSSVQHEADFAIKAPIQCPTCYGMGDETCPTCRGFHQIYPQVPGGDGSVMTQQLTPEHTDYAYDDNSPDYGPIHHGKTATTRQADHPLPQSDLLHMPEPVDSLRNEEICPVCGSSMDAEDCEVCGYVAPPEGFDNPDLEKAQQNVQSLDGKKPEQEDAFDDLPEGALGPDSPQGNNPANPSNQHAFAHINGEMDWEIEIPSRVAAQEAVPNGRPASDEPSEEVVEDQTQPVTSSVRTARDFIAAAGATKRGNMEHIADAASGAPAVASPDKRVDVDSVGGVMDASNESASKADSQVDVTGRGGTGVESVEAESTTNVEQGDEHSKNIEAIPTKTFDDGSSRVERQADPVNGGPFPASEDGVKAASWIIEGHDDGVWPDGGDGLSGGTAVKGTSPSDPVGNAQDRVNVLEHTTSPANNSGKTDTWSGTDGNGVTRQADPVTSESISRGEINGEDGANWTTASTHLFSALKLADLEVELGLLNADKKYDRIAALEQTDPAVVAAELQYAERVKTAGLNGKKVAGAGRVPSLSQPPAVTKEASVSESDLPDEVLFS